MSGSNICKGITGIESFSNNEVEEKLTVDDVWWIEASP
jgi:hypothetical protein